MGVWPMEKARLKMTLEQKRTGSHRTEFSPAGFWPRGTRSRWEESSGKRGNYAIKRGHVFLRDLKVLFIAFLEVTGRSMTLFCDINIVWVGPFHDIYGILVSSGALTFSPSGHFVGSLWKTNGAWHQLRLNSEQSWFEWWHLWHTLFLLQKLLSQSIRDNIVRLWKTRSF